MLRNGLALPWVNKIVFARRTIALSFADRVTTTARRLGIL